MMKKRTIAAVLALALCLAALAVPALAHGGRHAHGCARNICAGVCAGSDGRSPCCGLRYRHTCVDANRDGVCDYTHDCGAGYVDADRNGVCDNCGKTCAGVAASVGSVYSAGRSHSSHHARRGCGHH